MNSYLLKRLGMIVPTLFGITLVTFLIIQLAPGDPVTFHMESAETGVNSEVLAKSIVDETRKLYGLDRPLIVQYGLWVKRVVTFDFGNSYIDQRPVISKIKEALPITLTLNILSIFIVYIISIPIGILSAMRPNGWFDKFSTIGTFILYALPSFWVATILIVYLGGGDYINVFPIAGFISPGAETLPWHLWIANIAWHLVLPVICLTYGGFAFLSRFSKSTMLEVIRQDYIRTARAKGLTKWQAVFRHGFRNTLIPIVTLFGTLLPALLGGSVIIEQIFSIPGMGKLGFEAVLSRDYSMVMALATINAFLTLSSLFLTDIVYKFVDPRISYE